VPGPASNAGYSITRFAGMFNMLICLIHIFIIYVNICLYICLLYYVCFSVKFRSTDSLRCCSPSLASQLSFPAMVVVITNIGLYILPSSFLSTQPSSRPWW
jgi:hypothetical protein